MIHSNPETANFLKFLISISLVLKFIIEKETQTILKL
jgi:hypothetical protein